MVNLTRSSQLILRVLYRVTPIFYVGACVEAASRVDEPQNVPQWTAEEELRIGSVNDPELGFSNIGGMTLDTTGTLYVLDTQEREIRVFDEFGQLIRRIGRRGHGPGELESPFDFGLVGDTLWVSEMGGNQRVTLYSSSGSVIGTVPAFPKIFTGKTGAVRVTLLPGSLEPGGVLTSRHTSMVMGSDTVVVPQVR